MKVILNTTTNYEGRTFKLGDEADLPLNIAQRWINKGIAHLPARSKDVVKPPVKEVILPEIPFSDFVPNKEEQKIIDEYSEKQGWPIKEEKTDESIIFREPEISETETEFEPLPEVTEENIDELKTYKPKRKRSKKITEKADEDNS